MKVGIFLDRCSPEFGGANSLQRTIQSEIIASKNNDNEFYFLYVGKKFEKKVVEINNFKYVNVNSFLFKTLLTKIFLFFYSMKKRHCFKTSTCNEAAKYFSLDLIYFAFPINTFVECPYIYTIWDLGHRTTPYFPEVSRSGWLWQEREDTYENMVYRASYIITGNEEGKKEILENYPVTADKIRIVEFPVADFCKGEEKKPPFDLPKKFFFYPAQFWPHKNHICIINALKILKEKDGFTPTVVFSGVDWGNKDYIISKIKEYNLETQIIFAGFLLDGELKYLYTHATGMIFASLMGPNNMPPIEATYLHCPVIITDLDGHKEQLKDTALYFNGYKPEELANHIKSFLCDKNAREKIIEKEVLLGKEFENIRYFSKILNIIDDFHLIRNTWGKDFNYIQR